MFVRMNLPLQGCTQVKGAVCRYVFAAAWVVWANLAACCCQRSPAQMSVLLS